MVHASLFTGEGGFDLAAEWVGWTNAFHCEINPFCKQILKYYWPEAVTYDDITTTDFTSWRGKIDILSGGFPCQPYSTAGKRLGKEDERHLWPHMLRAIQQIKPRYVLGENVRGIISWNGGLVFDEVQADLEAEGYEVLPFLLPACGVNAPHRRERVWFVAHRTDTGIEGVGREWEDAIHGLGTTTDTGLQRQEIGQQRAMGVVELCEEWAAAHASSSRWENGVHGHEPGRQAAELRDSCSEQPSADTESSNEQRDWLREECRQMSLRRRDSGEDGFSNWPTQSPLCRRDDELSTRLDGITFSKWRNESIKAHGNAVVPELVFKIMEAIDAWEMLY